MLDTGMSRIDRIDSKQKAQILQRAIEIFQMEGFAEVAVAAVFERGLFHAVNVVSRNRNDRNVLALSLELTEFFDRLQAIQHRHIQIDHHQTGPMPPGYVERLQPVFSLETRYPFTSNARLSIMRVSCESSATRTVG